MNQISGRPGQAPNYTGQPALRTQPEAELPRGSVAVARSSRLVLFPQMEDTSAHIKEWLQSLGTFVDEALSEVFFVGEVSFASDLAPLAVLSADSLFSASFFPFWPLAA
jgi:hypothetical protein